MGKIFANGMTNKDLIYKVYKQFIHLNIKKQTEDLNRNFSKEDIQANRYMKRCSTLLIIRQMQIIITMSYCLAPFKIAVIKKYTNNKCLRVYGDEETLCAIGENVNWKTVQGFLKTKNKTITIILSSSLLPCT